MNKYIDNPATVSDRPPTHPMVNLSKIDNWKLCCKSYQLWWGFWSFVAELGCWIGLFIGLSVPDLFDYICLFIGKVFACTL